MTKHSASLKSLQSLHWSSVKTFEQHWPRFKRFPKEIVLVMPLEKLILPILFQKASPSDRCISLWSVLVNTVYDKQAITNQTARWPKSNSLVLLYRSILKLRILTRFLLGFLIGFSNSILNRIQILEAFRVFLERNLLGRNHYLEVSSLSSLSTWTLFMRCTLLGSLLQMYFFRHSLLDAFPQILL